MSRLRFALFLSSALPLASGVVWAQSSSSPQQASPRQLPNGLIEQNGVVMMKPIASSGVTGDIMPMDTTRRPGKLHTLSEEDHRVYSAALDAASRGDWIGANGLAHQGHNAAATLYVQWRYLIDRNSGAPFAEIAAFMRAHPEWPGQISLQARAEKAMPPGMPAQAVLDFFGSNEPVSGIGKVRLGEALIATGKTSKGNALIRKAWEEDSFEPDQELAIIQAHGALFGPTIDDARLNHLLWRDDLSAARRQISRAGPDARRMAEARMALHTNPKAGLRMVEALPASLRNSPGVMFDEARALRRTGNQDAGALVLARMDARKIDGIDPGRWWGELNLDARDALQKKNYHTAYRLAEGTGLSGGSEFAESEWLSGWIALRFLHDPAAALRHFKKLAKGVTRPISVARGNYWTGRAYEDLGDLSGAYAAYSRAAEHSDTFYGQLAQARIEATPTLHVKDLRVDTTNAKRAFERDEMTHVIRVVGDLGDEAYLRLFANYVAEKHMEPARLTLLADLLVRMGFPEIAVRVAKTASYDGINLQSYSHPLIALPAYQGPSPKPEPALTLGIIRQETEFNPDVISNAGARGLMQLMPSTAQKSARAAGLPYQFAALTTDATYNMKLGMVELAAGLNDWTGSYILTAAAYNAGPGNVKRWIAQNGDPRYSGVDPIDWIEEIPYSETRNYVQRVLENTQVYRNRLAGRDQPLQIVQDLYRPGPPKIKAMAYTPPAPAPAAAAPTANNAAKPKPRPAGTTLAPAPARSLLPATPQARPEGKH